MPERKKLLLRLDPSVYDAVARWAADDLRSINAQIEYILTEQVRKEGRLPHQPRRQRTEPPSDQPDDDDDSIDSEEPAATSRR